MTTKSTQSPRAWSLNNLESAGVTKGTEIVKHTPTGAGAVTRSTRVKFGEFVSIADYGDVTTSAATANAAFNAAVTAIGSSGGLFNPKGSLVDFSAVTVPNAVTVYDLAGQRTISSSVAVGKSAQAGGGHLLVRDYRSNSATRMHVEPNGNVTGVAAKLDIMADPYESDGTNYRIRNIYTKTYDAADTSTTQGNNGIVVDGVKGVGTHFGIYPGWHFGFSDDGAGSAVPFKLYYYDTSDTVWRANLKGGWRAGLAITTGDFILASNKLYQASTTGTTGATIPSHAAGTVGDGAVSWTFVRDFAAASGNFRGCAVFGDRDDLPKFGNSTVRAQFAKDAAFWNTVKLRFLDSSAASVWSVYTPVGTDDLYIENEAGTKRYRFDATGGFVQSAGLSQCCVGDADNSLSAAPSVASKRLITFGNASPVTVTSFSGGVSNQEFYVRTSNGQTTLAHNANIRLKGAANLLLTTDMTLLFVMNTAGTIAVQV